MPFGDVLGAFRTLRRLNYQRTLPFAVVEAALLNVNGGKVDPADADAQKSAIPPERQYTPHERLASWGSWALPEELAAALAKVAARDAPAGATPPKLRLDPEVARSLLLAMDAGLLTGPAWTSVPVDRRGWPLCRMWADVEASASGARRPTV